jgi:hypothetical protein
MNILKTLALISILGIPAGTTMDLLEPLFPPTDAPNQTDSDSLEETSNHSDDMETPVDPQECIALPAEIAAMPLPLDWGQPVAGSGGPVPDPVVEMLRGTPQPGGPIRSTADPRLIDLPLDTLLLQPEPPFPSVFTGWADQTLESRLSDLQTLALPSCEPLRRIVSQADLCLRACGMLQRFQNSSSRPAEDREMIDRTLNRYTEHLGNLREEVAVISHSSEDPASSTPDLIQTALRVIQEFDYVLVVRNICGPVLESSSSQPNALAASQMHFETPPRTLDLVALLEEVLARPA